MNTTIPGEMLALLSRSVAACFGLHFPEERWPELGKRIASVAVELGYQDVTPFALRFLSHDLTLEERAVVAKRLTVGETYFFRDPQSFEALERHVLPELIRERRRNHRRLRIWSAGCSSGEEAYSIAVLVRRMLPDIHSWNILILATDINLHMLRKAASGVYTQWSFRNVPERSRDGFCRRNGSGSFAILPEVREMVTFAHLNLASDHYPSALNNTGAMDIIFCRNVLMYFVPETIHETISRFYDSLADDGWFLSSPAEASLIDGSRFVPVNFTGAILYRKKEDTAKSPARFPDPMPPRCPWPDDKVSLRSPSPAVEAVFEMPDWTPPTAKPVPAASGEGEKDPKGDSDLYPKSLDLYREGRYEEAEKLLLRLLAAAPNHSTARGLLCRVYADQGKLDAALACVEKYLSIDQLKAGAHYLKATILEEMGRAEDARASLTRALYLDPGFVLAHFALGNIALREGRYAQARKSFENVIALSGGRPREELIPESEGMTAGALMDMVASIGSNLHGDSAEPG